MIFHSLIYSVTIRWVTTVYQAQLEAQEEKGSKRFLFEEVEVLVLVDRQETNEHSNKQMSK